MTEPTRQADATQEEILQQQVRKARSRFLAMAGAYSLGVFNDNFLKQGLSLLAITAALSSLQGWIAILFTLPFILLAAPAGWMADRFSKRTIVVGSKVAELVAMALAAVGLAINSWPLMLSMLFVMAAQSTVFSPALNGSIPDLYPAQYVLKANAHLKSVVTCFILLGIFCAGLTLDNKTPLLPHLTWGQAVLAGSLVAISLLGLLVSLGTPYRPPADPQARFPRAGPLETLRQLWALRRDPLLARAVWADVFIWFIGPLQVMIINTLAMKQFGLREAEASYLVLAELIGLAVGGLISGKVVQTQQWYRALAPTSLALAGFLLATAASPLVPASPPLTDYLPVWIQQAIQENSILSRIAALSTPRMVYVLSMLGCSGLAGGIFMVPLESFFQVRPAPRQRGSVLAAVNCAAFLGILAAGIVYLPLNEYLQPNVTFAVMGVLTLLACAWMYRVFREDAAAGEQARQEAGHD